MSNKYDWDAINHLYHEGRYTTTDLHLIFGPVPGHISKKLRIEGDARSSGKKSMQKSPNVFSKELNEKINRNPGIKERLNAYYTNVCLPSKALKCAEYIDKGVPTRAIAERLGIAQSQVVKLNAKIKGMDKSQLRESIRASKEKFSSTLKK